MLTLPNHRGSTSAHHHQSLAAALSDARAAAERQTRMVTWGSLIFETLEIAIFTGRNGTTLGFEPQEWIL